MNGIEEMTERNSSLSGIDRTIGEGTEKSSFREGEAAIATASIFDEDNGHFSSRLEDEIKIKRAGYKDLVGRIGANERLKRSGGLWGGSPSLLGFPRAPTGR